MLALILIISDLNLFSLLTYRNSLVFPNKNTFLLLFILSFDIEPISKTILLDPLCMKHILDKVKSHCKVLKSRTFTQGKQKIHNTPRV